MKYKVGQPIVTREGKYKGVIVSVKENAGILAPYEIKLENGDLVVCHDEGIQLDGDVLQAESFKARHERDIFSAAFVTLMDRLGLPVGGDFLQAALDIVTGKDSA